MRFLGSPRMPPESPDEEDWVSSTTAQDLPSTRSGGQDDMSSKQTLHIMLCSLDFDFLIIFTKKTY